MTVAERKYVGIHSSLELAFGNDHVTRDSQLIQVFQEGRLKCHVAHTGWHVGPWNYWQHL